MTDAELIRRGDAMIAMQKHANGETVLGGQTYQSLTLEVALEAINTIPAAQPTVSPDVAALVKALMQSREGWANALELGLIPEQHRTSAAILRDVCSEALARVKGVTPQTEYERKVAQMKEDFPNGI